MEILVIVASCWLMLLLLRWLEGCISTTASLLLHTWQMFIHTLVWHVIEIRHFRFITFIINVIIWRAVEIIRPLVRI